MTLQIIKLSKLVSFYHEMFNIWLQIIVYTSFKNVSNSFHWWKETEKRTFHFKLNPLSPDLSPSLYTPCFRDTFPMETIYEFNTHDTMTFLKNHTKNKIGVTSKNTNYFILVTEAVY